MAFDAKELMIDITKAGLPHIPCNPTFCGYPTFHCLCTYQVTVHCFPGSTILPCRLGTYTCYGSIFTCGGTIYCAGSNDPTILYQGIDRETLATIKAQLQSATKEVEQQEKRLAEAGKKG